MINQQKDTFKPVQFPEQVFYPPFNITYASHLNYGVRDLMESLRFYKGVIGMLITEQTETVAYLRCAEEACHHSLVLRQLSQGDEPCCDCIGFRVLTDQELDSAFERANANDISAEWIDIPHQSRKLRLIDPVANPLDFCAHMEVFIVIWGN